MNLSPDHIDSVLNLLGEHLHHSNLSKVRLVVCGGTALNVLKLVTRTTKDIDVIGRVDANDQWLPELPNEFWNCVTEVGEFYQLPKDWLNLGPQSYLETGLPEGLIERLVWKTYGPKFELGFISRFDQIHLKLYASADRAGYHVDDLIKLKPSTEEIITASKWCLEQDVSEGFKAIFISMLQQLGFDHEAGEI